MRENHCKTHMAHIDIYTRHVNLLRSIATCTERVQRHQIYKLA